MSYIVFTYLIHLIIQGAEDRIMEDQLKRLKKLADFLLVDTQYDALVVQAIKLATQLPECIGKRLPSDLNGIINKPFGRKLILSVTDDIERRLCDLMGLDLSIYELIPFISDPKSKEEFLALQGTIIEKIKELEDVNFLEAYLHKDS